MRAAPWLARWGLFWLVAVGVALAWGYANGPSRIEAAFMDHLSAMDGRPAPADIVIVAIDDRSIAELGRWPWRRRVHADLIDRLHAAGPRAIGLDLILTEPDAAHPDDDTRLAAAIARAGHVVLPLHMERLGAAGPRAALPVPALAGAAAALGHIHVELGRDGVARSVFLREGTAGQAWDHWALALLKAGGEAPPVERWPGVRRPPGDVQAGAWWRDYWMQVPFAGPPGHVQRVSYVDVLDGRVPVDVLRGRYVLVGATAAGLGDVYLTPMASEDQLMPGVEVTANVLDALHRGLDMRRATPWQNALFTALPVVLAMMGLYHLRPRWAFGTAISLMAAVYAGAWAALRFAGVQFAPLAALGCLTLVYPLWSWLRIEAAVAYLAEEVRQLQAHDKLLAALPVRLPRGGDELDRRMRAMASAVEQLRGLQQFVHESLDHLADPVLVSDRGGLVLLANAAAVRYFGMPADALVDAPVDLLLEGRIFPLDGRPLPPVGGDRDAEWPARDRDQRDLLVKWTPRRDPNGAVSGWIVTLVDISTVQQAQRLREEALRFISHDMRAPQSSILTLLELHRLDRRPAEPALFERIAGHAHRTLALADDFVHLARAQSDHYVFSLVDLADVVADAADRLWDQARARGVDLVTDLGEAPCELHADRDALTRAVANLVDNALKYGRDGGRVTCSLVVAGGHATIAVRDEGAGIPPAHQAVLFEPFHRRGETTGRAGGAGLGLAFVRAVVVRHQGTVEVVSEPGQGAEFRMCLPLSPTF
ncbi:CHASE2 domain-containing protein [Rhizobacter sp. Root1221]|uniref:CHASE2 domain-containing protein n=1 Tax=Rhizobacter sp. Root1221 TaxID=1736433 RepID=UPI0006F36F40|nr:CHASE2 domain-containing protein [Rhizobacter sp. Root1221]KQV96906.1 hypothetical protein ASC87_24600 [Rhizobacter sp. Root1221]